jgi:tetratricopeptide (TPR) repeat protein
VELCSSLRTEGAVIQTGRLTAKLERNMGLLELEGAERPFDPVTQFHRGWALAGLGRFEEAIVALHLSEAEAGLDSLHRKRQGLLARCYFKSGSRTEAMDVVRRAQQLYPDDVELLYTEAQLLIARGDLGSAEERIRRILGSGADARADCLDCSIFGWAGFYLLGLDLALQDRHAEAEEAMRQTTSLDPSLVPAWLVLADALACQGRLDGARELVLDPRVPPLVRVLVQAGALALDGAEGAALEVLPGALPGEHSLLSAIRRWVPRASSRAHKARFLDILRAS